MICLFVRARRVGGTLPGMVSTAGTVDPASVERVRFWRTLFDSGEVGLEGLLAGFAALGETLQGLQVVESKLDIRQSRPGAAPADDLVAVRGEVVLPALREPDDMCLLVELGHSPVEDRFKRAFDLLVTSWPHRAVESAREGPVEAGDVREVGARNHAGKQHLADEPELHDALVVPKLGRDEVHSAHLPGQQMLEPGGERRLGAHDRLISDPDELSQRVGDL